MFPIRLIGYDRAEVEERIRELQANVEELTVAYEGSQQQVQALQAQLEDSAIRLAAARRDRLQALSDTTVNPANAILLLGPVSTFAALAPLADALEQVPGLSIQFRIFRDGIYRLDAWVENMTELSKWLTQQPAVREVRTNENTLHVILRDEIHA